MGIIKEPIVKVRAVQFAHFDSFEASIFFFQSLKSHYLISVSPDWAFSSRPAVAGPEKTQKSRTATRWGRIITTGSMQSRSSEGFPYRVIV
jgi:hypothetical protein